MSVRGRALAVALVVLTSASVVIGAADRTRTSVADAPAEALLVGDSVMNAMQQGYGAAARAALAARHTAVLDTAGCRRLITTSCRIGGRPAPTNALQVVQARTGQYDRVLVVAAGYNDPTTGPAGLDTAVEVLAESAHQQGIDHVIWLTYREAGDSASRFRAHNALLRRLDAERDDLSLADWAGRSAGLPRSWFSGDGIHLGTEAAVAMAELIADAIDALPPAIGAEYVPDGPCRIVDTTVSPLPAASSPLGPDPAGPVTSIGDGGAAVAPARRLQLACDA